MRTAIRTFCAIILLSFVLIAVIGFIVKNGLEGGVVLAILVAAVLGIAFL
jgi:hypothetical protein